MADATTSAPSAKSSKVDPSVVLLMVGVLAAAFTLLYIFKETSPGVQFGHLGRNYLEIRNRLRI